MNYEATEIYRMKKDNNKVIFQKNIDGLMLISDNKTGKTYIVRNREKARKMWRDYQKKGYKRY